MILREESGWQGMKRELDVGEVGKALCFCGMILPVDRDVVGIRP